MAKSSDQKLSSIYSAKEQAIFKNIKKKRIIKKITEWNEKNEKALQVNRAAPAIVNSSTNAGQALKSAILPWHP